MKKLIASALLALTAMAGSVLAQSATDNQRPASGAAGARDESSASGTSGSTTRSNTADRNSGQSTSGTTRAQSGTQQRSQTASASQASQGGGNFDQHIAVCLTLGNQEEVALGQFAQDRAQNPQVKQFAQMMAEEHQQAISKLQQAVPQVASLKLELTSTQGASSASPSTTSATTASGNQRASATGEQGGGQEQQMAQMAREIKQECLNLTQAELGRKQGAEFDKAYIGQQLVAHTQMMAELKVAQRYVSGQLQPIIQEGTQMTEHHLAQARQIMDQLDAGGAEGAPRTGAAPQPRR